MLLSSVTISVMTSQQIDTLCDEFEAALRRGDTVRIEDVLLKVEESQRHTLLQELLEIKIQFAVETKQSEDYLRSLRASLDKSFPDEQEQIESLFLQVRQLEQVGDYEILDELGRGGMGTVYKAKHKLLQQTVAVKVLSEDMLDDTQAVGRFRREMQLIGGLAHPNIVRALNAGEADGIHYLAMEYVDGITLQKLAESIREKNERAKEASPPAQKTGSIGSSMQRAGGANPMLPPPLVPLGATCEMIRQAALGLQNAHELKLVHRDIKPANLMLDHRGTVKLLDLGLGKFADEHRQDYRSSLTMAGMVIGTVDYISPEQCENSSEADVRSDLYSLGCTLYFLLTGNPVYCGSRYDTLRKKLMAHIVGDVPSIRQTISGIPLAVEAILQKVLSKNPEDRFQTPLEFAEALEPFASSDDLWALTCEMLPASAADSRTGIRHASSPYNLAQSTRQNIVPPISRWKMIRLFVGLNLLFFACIVGVFFYFYASRFDAAAARAESAQAETVAGELLQQWKIAEAEERLAEAVRIRNEDYARSRDATVLKAMVWNRVNLAIAHWYHGDARRAGRDLQSLQDTMPRLYLDEQSLSEFSAIISELRADFLLFGGAASGRNSDRFSDRISLYNIAGRARHNDDPRRDLIRWKKAILSTLDGRLERAETLLEESPLPYSLPEEDRLYFSLVRQLAEAVLFYHQRVGNIVADENRNQKLRAFQRQFALPSNAMRETAMRPETTELLVFSAELLINDSLIHEDWRTLAEDFTAITNATNGFLRQHPGAIPFMRRFYELLAQSAVLLYENAEQPEDQQRQLNSIVRLLEWMRLPVGDSADGIRPTVIYFFLPETNQPEESFIIFYPQDGRAGTLYRIPLTRQMITQEEPDRFPPLPPALLEQVIAERDAGRSIRISWSDEVAWARTQDALTDADYPYNDVLPLYNRH